MKQRERTRENTKTIITAAVLLIFLLAAGCFNYKQAAGEGKAKGELSEKEILNEIAKVEQEVSVKAPEPTAVDGTVAASNSLSADAKTTDNKTTDEKAAGNAAAGAGNGSAVLPGNQTVATVAVENQPAASDGAVTEDKTKEDKTGGESEMQVITIKENEKIRLLTQLNDPDNDTINYTYSKPLDGKGEWKTNYGDAGEYVSTLTVTDGKLTTAIKVKIVVERVNVAPVIEQVKDVSVNEGETVKFTPEVKDPNNDKVTVTVSDPLKEGIFKTDHTSAGEYVIKVTASDGELSSEKSFKLVVKDVNVPPEINGISDMTVKEGELVALKPVVTDIDNDDLKLTISKPVGDSGTWQTTYTDHGEYVVSVSADDGKAKVTKQIKITVLDVNMPPEIVKISLQK